MSNERVGSLAVELNASANGLHGELEKATKDIHKFSKNARKELGDVDGDFLDRLAMKAKEKRADKRKSGESALESLMAGGPASFISETLLDSGIKGMIVDQIGKAFGSGAEAFSKLATGEMDPAMAIDSWAKGLPILGGFISGWRTIIDLTTGEATEAEKLARIMKEQELSARAIASLNSSSNALKQMTGDMGSAESWKLGQTAAISKERQSLFPTEADVKKELGPWMTFVEEMNLSMAKLGVKDLEEEAHRAYSNAELRVLDSRAGDFKALDEQQKKVDEQFKIMVLRSRRETASGMNGAFASILSSMAGMPGGVSPDSEKMQKLLRAYSQSDALTKAFTDVINNGDATAAQKLSARKGLQMVHQFTDLATGSQWLNSRPYEPLRFASAKEVSGYYGGEDEYAKAKDLEDYAKNNPTARTQEILQQILQLMQSALGNSRQISDAPLFPDGGGA